MYNNKSFNFDNNNYDPRNDEFVNLVDNSHVVGTKTNRNETPFSPSDPIVFMNNSNIKNFQRKKNSNVVKRTERKLKQLVEKISENGFDAVKGTEFCHVDHGKNFFSIKIGSHKLPIRVLFRYDPNNADKCIEVHMVHVKKGERNSEYITEFNNYIEYYGDRNHI